METGPTGTFGDLLRSLRISAALSQEALAERAGLSARGISDLERGVRRTPHLETVRLLADALGLDGAQREALIEARRGSQDEREPPLPAGAGFLPEPPTPLVGREVTLVHCRDLLESSGKRLLTLTGPGGVGKTRLALALAADLAPAYREDVHFVDLSAISRADDVAPAIVQALDVGPATGKSDEVLLTALRSRRVLLVLDNLEQLLDAAPLISRVLAGAAGCTIIATSRAPLRIRGEHLIRVEPLESPGREHTTHFGDIDRFSAVRLFVERAQDADPSFILTAANAGAVAEVCRRLDGLPLAIELAAARSAILPPQAMLARFDHALSLLTAGHRDAPERHQTLAGTIRWSYELLSPSARDLFECLAVFHAGWTMDAAEAVVAGGPDTLLDGMQQLIDSSLIQPVMPPVDMPHRYRMLETVQEFGRNLLAARPDSDLIHWRHARHSLAFARHWRPRIDSSEGKQVLDQFEFEHANLRAALAWALEHQDADIAVELAACLWKFWYPRGHIDEGLRWLEQALGLPAPGPPQARADALYGAGWFAQYRGDSDRAESYGQEALQLARSTGDDIHIATSLSLLSAMAHVRGDLDEARAGWIEALEIANRLNRTHMRAMFLQSLAGLEVEAGRFEAGAGLYAEALRLWQTRGDIWGIAHVLFGHGTSEAAQGNHARAARMFVESLELYDRHGDPRGIGECLDAIGRQAVVTGLAQQAVRLFGAAEAILESGGFRYPLTSGGASARATESVRATLGFPACDTGWAEGRLLTRAEAVDAGRETAADIGSAVTQQARQRAGRA